MKRYWLIGIVVFFGPALFGCQQEVNVPRELVGVWNTSSPKYTDRYIEFTEKALIFGLGNDDTSVHAIKKIKTEDDQLRPVYTLYYRDSEGDKWTLSLTYFSSYDDGAFQLQDRNEWWKRKL